MIELDQVVLAVQDLRDAGDRLLERSGLASVAGGIHERWGTANRIVPLGPQYIELIGIADHAVARRNDLGRRVSAAAGSATPWITWVVRSDDLDPIAARLRLDTTEGSRRRADGTMVRWRMAGFDTGIMEPPLPFFMQWHPDTEYPGAAPADHRTRPQGIAWIEMGGNEARLAEWLGGEPLPIRVRPGPPGIRRVGIATADGELVLDGSEVSPASP